MTTELKELIDQQLETALESKDQHQFNQAVVAYNKAMSDCQMKTSERVKTIVYDHPQLVNDVKDVKKDVSDIKTTIMISKAKMEGARLLWNTLKWICAIGGGSLIPYIVEALKQ